MGMALDPRTTPWRGDLAAASLRGRLEADAYAEGVERVVIAGSAPIRSAPRGDAGLASEALFGETFTVFEERGGWAWGQLATDRYVGYLPAELLGGAAPPATHRVAALRSYLHAGPGIKGPTLGLLSLNALARVSSEDGVFSRLDGGGFVVTRHLAPVDAPAADFVAVAERFAGTPYLWGGRTSVGLDCSALVQLSLAAAGIAAPRDSDMQEREIGEAVAAGDARRGDLVFWPGHVAIMVDGARVVHANAHHMETVIEPLDAVTGRVGQGASVRRLSGG